VRRHFVGGRPGSDKSADLSRPKGDGETERGGDVETGKIFSFAPSPPLPPLPLFFSSGDTYDRLRVLRDLSHCKSPRQVFYQIIDVFDADREAN
jgi:hypothetical protein